MALISDPVRPWHLLVAVVALLATAALLARSAYDALKWLRRKGPAPGGLELVVMLCSLLAVALLAFSALNPKRIKPLDPGSVYLAVVLDVSDSTLRIEGGWSTVRGRVVSFLKSSLDRLPADVKQEGQAFLITFRDSTTSERVSLSELVDAVSRLDEGSFASGRGSDIGTGLERARQELGRVEGRRAILLVSDGNDTHGQAWTASQGIARAGIPITVLPIESGLPEISLSSLNLPESVNADQETLLRGVVWNQSDTDVRVTVRVLQNAGLDTAAPGLFGLSMAASSELTEIPAGRYAPPRQPLTFKGVGLEYVDVQLLGESGETLHQRRLYTYVQKPIELLAIAGNNRWVGAIPVDVAHVTQITPEQLASYPDLTWFDAVVLSEVQSSEFKPDQLERLVVAVEQGGVGLFVMNGGHGTADEQAETVLRSYAKSVVDRVLPVSTEPRPDYLEPQPRQVIVLIDSSPSMFWGWEAGKAKQIASYVIAELLRDQDTFDVCAFSGGATYLFRDQPATSQARQDAVQQINSLLPGGGTEPWSCLSQIGDRQWTDCGLFFISDCEFGTVTYRPDCRATIFVVQDATSAACPLEGLNEVADLVVVGPTFDPARIEIPYFEPKKRDKFFERGRYAPLSMASVRPRNDFPQIPNLPLEGTAISYTRPEAELMAVRSKPFIDPVLVYGTAGNGYVGVLTTGLPTDWLGSEEGQEALLDWLRRLSPYAERDRYAFEVQDDGDSLLLRVALRGDDGHVPQVLMLSAQIEVAAETYSVPITRHPEAPATFDGVMRIPRLDHAQEARLIINETGPESLTRPQRIPILIPPKGTMDAASATEANSYGLNTPLLKEIAQTSGGEYDPEQGASFFSRTIDPRTSRSYWAELAAAGALCYLLAVALHRLCGERRTAA